MSASNEPRRASAANPGEVVDCVRDLLPRRVSSHPDFDEILAYLHRLDPDISSFWFYIEWNLRSGDLDLTFTFPTTLADSVRIRFWDLANHLVGVEATGHAAELVDGVRRRLGALPLDAPFFPRAVSFSLGPIRGTNRSPSVELVFLDFGPLLDLSADPGMLDRAFGLLEPSRPQLGNAESPRMLERVGASLVLAHVGAGWRRGRPLHKAYLRGRLDALVGAAVDGGAAPLIGGYVERLEHLARKAGHHVAHIVLDETSGRLTRVGFELNFDLIGAAGFPRLAMADALWADAVPGDLRGEAERVLELGSVGRHLGNGALARFRVSHLKVSFDGSGKPEWKAYLSFQRSSSQRTGAAHEENMA